MATAPAAQPLRITGTIYAIPVMDIDFGERLRPIDRSWAAALGQVIAREGQRTPIEVVNYKGKGHWDYTLVAGAHRLAAMAFIDQPTIEAIIVDASGIDHRMREVSENLWRRGLDRPRRGEPGGRADSRQRADPGRGGHDDNGRRRHHGRGQRRRSGRRRQRRRPVRRGAMRSER